MITICGPNRKIETMRNLADAFAVKTNVPDDTCYAKCSDLIQCRADYLNKITYSNMVVVVGEWTDAQNQVATFICPAQTGRITMCNALRELGQALSLDQTQMDSKLIYHDEDSYNAVPRKIIGECVEGFEIGESTSYEMMWALRNKVPVLILQDNDIVLYLTKGDSGLIFPSADRIFRCSDIEYSIRRRETYGVL